MLRKNSLIPVIAVLLVLLFEALRPGRNGKMRLGLLIMAVCLAVTSVGILPLVQKCYEKKAGNTLSSGVTAMSYLAMGMQEASRGCGWYNGTRQRDQPSGDRRAPGLFPGTSRLHSGLLSSQTFIPVGGRHLCQ